jgi:hypothetical protein
MKVADSTIEGLLESPFNQAICGLLLEQNPSAHSDVTEELRRSAALLPSHQSYCPNPARYAYVILLTDSGRIFAAALGMKAGLFNLPAAERSEALADGAKAYPGLPPEWVVFDAFRADQVLTATPKRLRRWCEAAFAGASAAAT